MGGWSELVDTLRSNFERKYAENITKGVYDPRDVDRIRNDFRFARTFIRGRERLEEGADLINTSLTFKNELKLHDVTEESFGKELLDLGALYFRARDLKGSRILWLKVRLHRKDAAAEYLLKEKLGVIVALEKALGEDPLKPVVVVLDMSNCGLVNMDIEFVKFIITCFKFYYPTFLDYMLIYDMPWLFNAAWKIVKAWLSAEASAKIKFVSKSNVHEFIHRDCLPPHMGGTDDFKFVYTPGMSLEPLYPPEENQDEKRVTFEAAKEVSEMESTAVKVEATKSAPTTNISTNNNSVKSRTTSSTSDDSSHSGSRNSSTNNSSNLRRRTLSNTNNNSNDKNIMKFVNPGGAFLISPADQLSFPVDQAGDAYDIITLSNTLSLSVAFKVKTTSPEKYRVRPSSGVVLPGKTEEVFVYLTEEHKDTTTAKDKFLIMALEIPESNQGDTSRLWKEVAKDNIMEHRLKCVTISKLGANGTAIASSGDRQLGMDSTGPQSLEQKVDLLQRQTQNMQRQLNTLILLQILTTFFLLLTLVSFSCFGDDLLTKLAMPWCGDKFGRRC